MPLEMKNNCQTCAAPLAADGSGADIAYICSFECTFCSGCTTETHRFQCPNCGGELVLRPRRETG